MKPISNTPTEQSFTDKMRFGAIKEEDGEGYFLYGYAMRRNCMTIDDFVHNCKFAEFRLGICWQYIWNYHDDTEIFEYKNWTGLDFPLIREPMNLDLTRLMLFSELPDNIKTACRQAERHKFIDGVFEEYMFRNVSHAIIRTREDWLQLDFALRAILLDGFKIFI